MTTTAARPTRTTRRLVAALVAAGSLLAGPALTGTAGASTASTVDDDGAVVIANRGSGDVTVIDIDELTTRTVDLPGEAEPMYVSHDRDNGRVLVGDRATDTVVALDDESYQVVGSVAVGDGVFHQWYDGRSGQLWVVGDEDRTVTVVDGDSLSILATIPLPADLVDQGGKPHDVFVSGRRAFVSMVGFGDDSGAVVRYSTRSFAETGRVATGGDPHVFVAGPWLYVASQDASTVTRYGVASLRIRGEASVPAAHGLFVNRRREVFVTNIAGGGVDGVYELNGRLTTTVDVADTPVATPHNVTVDDRRRLWVTHSGATADQVTVVDLERRGFGDAVTVTAGTNPFGLAFVD